MALPAIAICAVCALALENAGDHLHMYLYKINQPDRGTDLQSISGQDKNIFVPILFEVNSSMMVAACGSSVSSSMQLCVSSGA